MEQIMYFLCKYEHIYFADLDKTSGIFILKSEKNICGSVGKGQYSICFLRQFQSNRRFLQFYIHIVWVSLNLKEILNPYPRSTTNWHRLPRFEKLIITTMGGMNGTRNTLQFPITILFLINPEFGYKNAEEITPLLKGIVDLILDPI